MLRGELFEVLKTAALGGDTKLAQWLYEEMTEEGEVTWEETLPNEGDKHAVRQHLYAHPTPELLADLHAAGVKLVPLTEADKALPAPILDGEFEET